MITLEKRLWKILNDAPNPFIYKIFIYIALNQPDDGICGFKIAKSELAFALQLKRSSFFNSIKWLKDNLLIQELKFVEDSDFMANPYLVMNNSNRDERIAEWNRRCQIDIQKELANRKRKRRLELKNSKK